VFQTIIVSLSLKIFIYLAEGHKIIYDQELPIELRLQDTDAGPKVSFFSSSFNKTYMFIILGSRDIRAYSV
jgi:hypothetical protein